MKNNPFDAIFFDPAKFCFENSQEYNECEQVNLSVTPEFFSEIKDFLIEYARIRGAVIIPIFNRAYGRLDKFLRGNLKGFGWERSEYTDCSGKNCYKVELDLIVLKNNVR